MMPANLCYANAVTTWPTAPAPPPIPTDMGVNRSGNVITANFGRRGLRVAAASDWLTVASSRLERLRSYGAGWDGPASRAISPYALTRAGHVLTFAFDGVPFPAPPRAVPCADGSLQLEWWLTDTCFEIYVACDGSMTAWAEDRVTGQELEREGSEAINLLLQWARRLTADKLIATA